MEFKFFRAWINIKNIYPISDHKIEQKHSKNKKFARAKTEMEICIKEVQDQLMTKKKGYQNLALRVKTLFRWQMVYKGRNRLD